MKILILGGTGFFGKSILHSFIRGNLNEYNIDSINVLSRNVDAFLKNYPEFKKDKIQYIKGDLTTINILPKADIIIHAANSTSIMDYKFNPKEEKRNIELGTLNYIQIAKKIHKNAKIIYCSSGAVYGKQPSEVEKMDEDFPFQDILMLPEEKRDYALGKRFAEEYIKKLGSFGLNVSIARCFAFYGDYLPKDAQFAYGNFLSAAKQGKDIEVKAKHKVIRSYMHADDLVVCLLKIVSQASPKCPIYNVGSDKAISIEELATNIANQFNVKVIKPLKIDSKIIDRYIPNTNKLKKLLKTI